MPYFRKTRIVPKQSPTASLRVAKTSLPGVTLFFYLRSTSGAEYVVQHVRRNGRRFWACNCPSHTFRMMPTQKLCKHARALKLLRQELGGVSELAKRVREVQSRKRLFNRGQPLEANLLQTWTLAERQKSVHHAGW